MSSDARADRAHRAGDERSRAPVRLLRTARRGGFAGFHRPRNRSSRLRAGLLWHPPRGVRATAQRRGCGRRRAVGGASASRLRARIRRRRGRADRRPRRGRPPGARAAAAQRASAAATRASFSIPTETGSSSPFERPAVPGAGRPRSRIVPWLCSRLRSSSASSSSKRWSGCSPAPERAQAGLLSSKGRRESASRVCSRLLGPRRSTCAYCQRGGASSSASCRSGSSGSCSSRRWWRPTRRSVKLCWPGRRRWQGPFSLPADPEAAAEPSFSALHGLYWLAVNLADAQPLLVAVDDAHWADVDSLRWLMYLARRLEGVPLALVLTTRPAEAGPVQELLDELLLIPEIAILQPGGLSEQAIAMLAAQLLAAEPDPSFVSACRQATGGNPFLLIELFGELDRRGIAPSRENAGLAGQLSSQGVGRAVRARLRRLPPNCTALARAVAVLGDPAEPTLAAQLAGLVGDAASHAADALAEAVIFAPGRRLRVRPSARALQRVLRAELPGTCPPPRARRPPAHGRGRGDRSDRRAPAGDQPGRRCGDGEHAATGGQRRNPSRRPRRRRHLPAESSRRAAVVRGRTGACPRAGQGRAQRRRARDGDRAAPAGDPGACRSAAARGSGKRARVGALPRGSAGRGDGRSHRGHRRATRERARAGTAAPGDTLGGREGRQRCGLASSPGN